MFTFLSNGDVDEENRKPSPPDATIEKEEGPFESIFDDPGGLLDVELYSMEESFLDQSITKTVKQLVDSPPSAIEPTPLEKLESIFKVYSIY